MQYDNNIVDLMLINISNIPLTVWQKIVHINQSTHTHVVCLHIHIKLYSAQTEHFANKSSKLEIRLQFDSLDIQTYIIVVVYCFCILLFCFIIRVLFFSFFSIYSQLICLCLCWPLLFFSSSIGILLFHFICIYIYL